MSLLTRLHQHKLHNAAHYRPFLERYHKENFTVRDHYRHLKQILPIYEALEKKVAHTDFQPRIPEHLAFALARSNEIKQDIVYLEGIYPEFKSIRTLPATNTYVDMLNGLDVTTPEGSTAIFSHFLLRILGDLFGGQGLKGGAIEAYKRAGIYSEATPAAGTLTYQFRKDALKDFSKWLNDLKLDNEDAIVDVATDGYQRHIDIFNELEATRVTRATNSASFFACANLVKAVAAGTAITVTAGLVLSRLG